MADSSKSTGLEKPMANTKNDPKKESKKKRKQGKKFRAKFTEDTEEKSQECPTLVGDEQNVEGSHDVSEANVEKSSQMSATNEETEKTAEKGEDSSASHSDQATGAGAGAGETEQENKTKEKSTNKNKESSGEQRKSIVEQVKQDQTDGSKKNKRSSFILLRSKKNSKSRPESSAEVIDAEDMTDETGIWTGESDKITRHEYETIELKTDGNGESQIEQGAKPEEVKSKEAESSLERTQEKSVGKGNKSKKVKHLPSFGRNKKKAVITNKNKDVEVPENETQESKDEDTKGEVSEKVVIESNEPVLVDFDLKEPSAVVEAAEVEGEKKDEEATKKKKSFLTLKRNKSQAKKRKLAKGEDEPKAKTNESEVDSAGKQNEDVSGTDGQHGEAEGAIETEENNSENKEEEPSVKETKDVEPQAKETLEAYGTEEVSVDKETSFPEGKEEKATTVEGTGQDSSNKNKKPSILRSFRKLKKSKQGKKKQLEKEEKQEKIDQEDGGEKVGKEDATVESGEMVDGKNEGRSDNEEGTPQAVKRKTSDLKNIGLSQAQKRKKEDGENFVEDISDVKESSEPVEEEKDLKQQDQDRSEETVTSRTEENELSPQQKEKLSQQKNNEQEQIENEESEEEDENPRVFPASDDTRDEEIWKEAHELRSSLMKIVKDVKEMKETEGDDENETQVEKTEVVELNTDSEGALIGSQMEAGEIDENEAETSAEGQDAEQDFDDESYESAITVVSVEQLPSQETKIVRDGMPLDKEGATAQIETTQVTDPEVEPVAENSETGTSDLIKETSRIENTTEPKTEEPKEHSETETSQVTEQPSEEEKLKIDPSLDVEEESYDSDSTIVSVKQMQSEEPQIGEAVSQAEKITEPKAENPEDVSEPKKKQLQGEQTLELKTEEAEEQRETEISKVSESPKEETEQQTAEPEDTPPTDKPLDSESQVHQANKVETSDTEEIRAIAEETVLESEGDGPKFANKTESKDVDAEEMQVSKEADSMKAEDNKEPKTDTGKPQVIEPKLQQEASLDTSPVSRSQAEQETERKTEDTEETQAIQGISSESEVATSRAECKAEPKEGSTEGKQAIDKEPASEKVKSKATKTSTKMDKLLQRRIVESVLTEPENDEKNADEEIVMELTEKKSKKDKKCEKETWVMVQHFEMTDEIARQLGHMLTLNAFKRTTTCCTIM
ncbi:uncharacterized protein [Porites lutea]|uniref:uncharacterized protein n=1 Tax=Porites lutea TaxID=51062 RepID=UPI003CC51DF2